MTLSFIWNKALKKLRGVAIKNSQIDMTSKIESGSQIVNSTMDKYSYCGYDCKIINCEIGSFCSIADNVIIGGACHPIEWASTSPVFYKGKDSIKKKMSEYERPKDPRTIIGNDVWIGDRVIIKSGVIIGDGAVIGMGSIVTKNVGAYEIWAGVPAKMIRERFQKQLVEEMERLRWWDLSDEIIQDASASIKNPQQFVERIKEVIEH